MSAARAAGDGGPVAVLPRLRRKEYEAELGTLQGELVALQEWLLWTAITVFGLILVCAIFSFWFLIVIGTIIVGCATFIWIRFVRFPPLIAAYNNQLRRARFYSQQRYKTAEATVRTRKSASTATGKRRRRR